jgi:iron(III) transport system ATP-binding protein
VPNTTAVSIPSDLTLENICFSINGSDVVDDVSLHMPSGSVTCLLGPSGSGKTTLLRIAAGMERQTQGTVLLDGVEIGGAKTFLPPEKRGVGLIFQDYALFPHLTVLQNVGFGLNHLDGAARHELSIRVLDRVGLADRGSDYPTMLSGGEQQRVALARALAPRPGVLLMDEPFSGLDSRLRDEMREETLGILRETRATSVLVTHDPEEALRMGDQIALLRGGCLEQVGTGPELYNEPCSLFAAGFFSELNRLDVTVTNGVADTIFGKVEAPGVPDGDAILALRITSLDLAPKGGVAGTILSRSFAGNRHFLRVGVAGLDAPLRLELADRHMPDINGNNVHLALRKEGVFVFTKKHS